MISFLEGTILLKGEKFLIIQAAGIGYKAFLTQETLRKIPEKGHEVKLWTHEHIRENARELYAFLSYAELELFELLISVPGIGPKSGLSVLALAPADTIKKAIAAGDTSYLTRVSGIGRKTAEKIVIELKEKMAGRGLLGEAPELSEEADALEALVALGYSARDAREALTESASAGGSAEDRVKQALKKLSSVKK